MKEIKDLVNKFRPEHIEDCISQQVETGENICLRDHPADKTINYLSKAGFVRGLMEQGVSQAEAVRELAGRMRLVQKSQDDVS
jgi:hypothetical protein